MYTSICVPLDGSPFADQATSVAINIARRSGGVVELAHVHAPLWLWRDGVPVIDPTFDLEQRRHMQTWLEAFAQRLTTESGLAIEPTLMVGDVVPTLERHIRERGIDLVVIATHGRSGLSRLWLGSVADGLVRTTSVPALLIRPAEPACAPVEDGFRHVLIPLDGSELAEAILDRAIALAGNADTEYSLLRVVEPMSVLDPFPGLAGVVDPSGTEADQQATITALTQEAEVYLAAVADELRRRGATVRTHVGVNPSPAQGILAYASKHRPDLIALATSGRGGLARTLIGSVADKVVRGASTPVLVYRPTTPEQADGSLAGAL